MAEDERLIVQRDLFRQGLEGVNPDDVIRSMDLYLDLGAETDFVYDPDDETWMDEVYAPTAAELHPDLVPPSWPR